MEVNDEALFESVGYANTICLNENMILSNGLNTTSLTTNETESVQVAFIDSQCMPESSNSLLKKPAKEILSEDDSDIVIETAESRILNTVIFPNDAKSQSSRRLKISENGAVYENKSASDTSVDEFMEQCDENIPSDGNLEDFMDVFTIYRCKFCHLLFSVQSDLISHLRCHSSKKCTITSKDNKVQNIVSAVKDVQNKKSEPPTLERHTFLCGQCTESFVTLKDCWQHMINDHNIKLHQNMIKAQRKQGRTRTFRNSDSKSHGKKETNKESKLPNNYEEDYDLCVKKKARAERLNAVLESPQFLLIMSQWNSSQLSQVVSSSETCMKWCENNGLIPTEAFCSEQHKMKLLKLSSGIFRCKKKHKTGKEEKKSRVSGTYFSRSKLEPRIVMIITFCFLKGSTYDETIQEASLRPGRIGRATIRTWFFVCREYITNHMLALATGTNKLGGRGKIVEIDVRKFERHRYSVERAIDGSWVLGMVDRHSNQFRIEVCPANSLTHQTLIPFILKNVEIGSVIITDNLVAFNTLDSLGYFHYTTDRSKDFINPVTGVKTETIDSTWESVHAWLMKPYRKLEKYKLGDRLMEYLFRRYVYHEKLDIFQTYLDIIKPVHKT